MKNKILRSGAMLVLALAAQQHTNVSAQQSNSSGQNSNAIEGVWFAVITPVSCEPPHPAIPNAESFRGLYMFGHDGSLTNEAAFHVPAPLRSGGLGHWEHTQGNTYTDTFRFFRYQENGQGMVSFLGTRKVTMTLVLNGDTFTSFDQFQDYGFDNTPLPPGGPMPTSGCNAEIAYRMP